MTDPEQHPDYPDPHDEDLAALDVPDLPAVDTPPSDGAWVDHDDLFATATDEDIAEGNRQGATIDHDNDDDTGGVLPVDVDPEQVQL